MDPSTDEDYGLVVPESDHFLLEVEMLIVLDGLEPILALMRRYNNQINGSLLIALDQLILLEKDLRVLFLFIHFLEPHDLNPLILIRVWVDESKLHTFYLFTEEEVKLQYQLFLFIKCK